MQQMDLFFFFLRENYLLMKINEFASENKLLERKKLSQEALC